jgi:hypothetical protein
MSKSIKNRTAALANKNDAAQIKPLLDAVLADLAALRANHNTLVAKLNLDATVTDTDYAVAAAATLLA